MLIIGVCMLRQRHDGCILLECVVARETWPAWDVAMQPQGLAALPQLMLWGHAKAVQSLVRQQSA
jgi:hypothetical protein